MALRSLGDDKLTMTLRAARVNAGLTQKEAANEKNPKLVTVETILKMCDLYHTNLESLFLQ